MNDVAQALRAGLDRLRERGLAKGRFLDAKGAVCARGALFDATPGTLVRPNSPRADWLLCDIAREQYPDRTRNQGVAAIVLFNDHPDTTQEDVERVFEKAILRAEEMVS